MPKIEQGQFQRCILCNGVLPFEDLILELTDPELGSGQLHRSCRGYLEDARANLAKEKIGPCLQQPQR